LEKYQKNDDIFTNKIYNLIMRKNYIITVNGPGSSGKSSAALEVSKALGFAFLSTGNVYRSFA
jgi:chloramphenicol 3-O-phosphotransferase